MNDTIDTTSPHGSSTPAYQTKARRLGVTTVVAVLIGATACGSNTPAATAPTNTSTASTTSIAASTTTVNAVVRPTATIDQLVGADGTRVHVRCVGQGDTTVLLIAGFGGDVTGWVKVEPAIAGRARVCSYDRPGTGTSDPATATTTFTTEATDLHALLRTIGEPGPYVVVGHSFGGAEAVTFASRFADEVSGLVLIDASPTTWPAAMCAVADDDSEAAKMARGMCAGAFAPTGNSEHLDVAAAFAEVDQINSLGSMPMSVITATDRTLDPGLAVSEVARLTTVWNQGQQAWVALSNAAHLVSVDHSGHHIEIEHPGVVIDEINRLLP